MDMTHTVGSVTVAQIATAYKAPGMNESDVKFIVKYPEDYKGPRFMPEGPVITSKESAEKFTAMGIGQVEKPDADQKDGSANASAETTDYSKLNKDALKEELKRREIEFPDTANKADLIAKLQENDASKQKPDADQKDGSE